MWPLQWRPTFVGENRSDARARTQDHLVTPRPLLPYRPRLWILIMSQSPWIHWRERVIGHDPVFNRPSRTWWTSQDTDERISPLIEIVDGKCSIGFNRTQNKAPLTWKQKPKIIVQSISRFYWFDQGEIHSSFVIRGKWSKRKRLHKKSSVYKSRERFSSQQ
jgi:hypothetical protein